jgi:hypothetical protein
MKEEGAKSEMDFHTLISGNGLLGQVLTPGGLQEAYHGSVPYRAACFLEILTIK